MIVIACGLLVFLVSVIIAGCTLERDTTISINDQNPPTFYLRGSGHQDFFLVRELTPGEMVPPSRRPVLNSGIQWQIWPPDGAQGVADKWPPVTYSKLPLKFTQTIPEVGQPTALQEGKFYEAGGLASGANGSSIWFTIRNGKAVRIPKPEEG